MTAKPSIAGLLAALFFAWPALAGAGDAAQRAFAQIAKTSGMPQVPGLKIVYLSPLGDPRLAPWKNIIVHQTEGPPGSAHAMAKRQAANPKVRGVTLWVETDGTVYWSVPETAVTLHGDGANRNDNKYVNNLATYRQVIHTNSIGVEFVGNFPDVRKPATAQQVAAWFVLVKFLQERYGIPVERVYAHNWIDYKDRRYCEGCDLAERARALGYVPGRAVSQVIALPKPKPAALAQPPELQNLPSLPYPEADAGPSPCDLRLAELAEFTPLPTLDGPGECGAAGVVQLNAVTLSDRSRVRVTPPAALRCTMAEALAHFVRDDMAPAAASLGAPLAAVVSYDSYECRGRNRAAGAKISEHGKGNAIDIRAVRLGNGKDIELTDPAVAREFRERVRATACSRFNTVLGPGSDSYHESHVHLDLAERSGGYKMCQWDVREPTVAANVPLPPPRPSARDNSQNKK